MIGGKCSCLRAKAAHISGHLPPNKSVGLCPKGRGDCRNHSALPAGGASSLPWHGEAVACAKGTGISPYGLSACKSRSPLTFPGAACSSPHQTSTVSMSLHSLGETMTQSRTRIPWELWKSFSFLWWIKPVLPLLLPRKWLPKPEKENHVHQYNSKDSTA